MPRSRTSHVQEIESFSQNLIDPVSLRDPAVQASWRRCLESHQLDPSMACEAYIVPEGQLRVHRQEYEDMIRIARCGLERLYQQLAGLNYVLLLADRHGVTVDFLGHDADRDALRNAGLYLGAEWREDRAGTCAVGACLESGKALVVHQSDHFDFTHSGLSCTAAPIYDLHGELAAVLDLSLLQAPAARASQSLALHLVTATARRVELTNLMEQSRQDWVIRFSRSPDFLDVDPEAAITVDAHGRIRGMTHTGARTLAQAARIHWDDRASLLGQPLENFFHFDIQKLPSLMRNRPAQERIVEATDGSTLFAHAIEPHGPQRNVRALYPTPALPVSQASAINIPTALRQLSSAQDATMEVLLHKAAKLAKQALPLMLQGETGAGKEYLARAIHQASGRTGEFIAINCAAIPEPLLESELFGYLPGTYTGGAQRGKVGLVETAHKGTLFLDEIGDMPLHLQTRLLRVLSESEVMPLGARTARPVNIRVISASHHALDQLVQSGKFREDLYYRLNAALLNIPPLRQRQDLDFLINTLLKTIDTTADISPAARQHLHTHVWPGNLRELDNVLRYACAMSDGKLIMAEHLPENLVQKNARKPLPPQSRDQSINHIETQQSVLTINLPENQNAAEMLQNLLQACQGNVSEVARRMGVSRSTVHRKINRLLGTRQAVWQADENPPHAQWNEMFRTVGLPGRSGLHSR